MWHLETLKKRKTRPRAVVDVGAGQGNPHLYEAFHVLVEPLREHEPALRNLLTRYEGECLIVAVGSSELGTSR